MFAKTIGSFGIALASSLFAFTAVAEDPATLKVWTVPGHDLGAEESQRELFAQFEEAHPNIKIDLTVMPEKGYEDRVTTALGAGSGVPDVIVFFENNWLPEALDLTPYIEADPDISADMYYPEFWNNRVVDGDRIIALPFGIGANIVLYNKDVFDAAGVKTYLELGSVHALERWLAEQGVRSKRWCTRAGKTRGGRIFSRGALFHLLRNQTYLGMIVHKGRVYPGMHPAIVTPELFDEVQKTLDAHARRHASRQNPVARVPHPGRLFNADGQPMSPTFSYGKMGKLYRYYVSAPLQQGRRPKDDDDALCPVAAADLEALLTRILGRLAPTEAASPLDLPTRAEIHAKTLQLLLPVHYLSKAHRRLADGEQIEADPVDPSQLRLTLPIRLKRFVAAGPRSLQAKNPQPNPAKH